MRLFLYHGRDHPANHPEDWGFDGPELFGVEHVTITYFNTFRVGFKNAVAFKAAQKLTGWPTWDDLMLEMKTPEDLVEANGKFYGDWTLDEEKQQEIF